MKKLLLIDANALIHRAFHALPPMSSRDGKATNAVYGLASILLKIWREERPDFAAALFDRPEPTFRKQEYAEYKAHRPKAADELIQQIIESHGLFDAFGIKTLEEPGFEADDLIGTLVNKFYADKLNITILTGDLDALQLVRGDEVVVKTLKTGVSKTIIYDEKAVIERYGLLPGQLTDYKALVGDPSDNIPGLQGVGPKTAATLLQKYRSLDGIYKNLSNEPKIREKFQSKEKEVLLYKKLSEIRKDAPVLIGGINELQTEDISENVINYFDNLGFESLKQRVIENKKTDIKISEPAELFPVSVAPLSAMTPVKDVVFVKASVNLETKAFVTSKTKAGFNLKAMFKEARRQKILFPPPYFDFGVAFWLLDPDFKSQEPEVLFKRYLRKEWRGVDDDYILTFQFLKQQIELRGLSKVFYKIEMPLLPVLADMEANGISLSKEKLQKLLAQINKEIQALEERVCGYAGYKINLNSPKQLSALIFEKLNIGLPKTKKTSTGLKSTNEEALNALKGSHPVVDDLLQYREIFKLKSTYIEPALQLTGADGRLRTTYVQTGTATGRLSSQNPNLQNIPGSGKLAHEFKSAFASAPGHTLCAFDYSQIELRVLASVANDKNMKEAFNKGEDIHAATAATVFNVPLTEVTQDMRRLAKTLNFGIVYGMGATAFAKNTGLKREEAKKFIENYFHEFKSVKSWHEKVINEAKISGFVKNENGRIRNVPALKFGMYKAASDAERAAINMPIQGLAADIVKLAMISISDKVKVSYKKGEVKMLLTIHDELLFEVRDDMIKEVSELVKEIMCSSYKLSVPIVVNLKTGKNWGSLQLLE